MAWSPLLLAALAAPPSIDLRDLLPDRPVEVRAAAFEAVGASGAESYLPPLLDLLALAATAEEWYRVLDTMTQLIGEPMRGVERPWRTTSLAWFERAERALPPDYLAFKRELFATHLSPEFDRFLAEDRGPFPPLDEIAFGGVIPGDIPALDHPAHVAAGEATFLPEDAPVIGVVVAGEARAYPNRILDWHELANDTLGDRRIALSWCTLCGAAIAYDASPRTTADTPEPLTFDTSGLLWRSNKLMFDSQTGSLWDQLTGRAVSGPMRERGAHLTTLETVTTTFGAWRREHPRTTVVLPDTGHDRDYSEGAAYGEYFASPQTMFPTPRLGRRFTPKERVVVVRLDDERFAVPLSVFEDGPVHQLERNGTRVVLVDRSSPTEAELPGPWRAALEDVGGAVGRPSGDDLVRAARRLGPDPPPLDRRAWLSLPRSTRAAALQGALPGVPLSGPVRSRLAVAHLATDVRAYLAGDRTFTGLANPDTLTSAHARPQPLSGLPRLPSHLAFGFAAEFFGPP